MQHAWLDGVEVARVSYAENCDIELESMQHHDLLQDWLWPANATPSDKLGSALGDPRQFTDEVLDTVTSSGQR